MLAMARLAAQLGGFVHSIISIDLKLHLLLPRAPLSMDGIGLARADSASQQAPRGHKAKQASVELDWKVHTHPRSQFRSDMLNLQCARDI